MRAYDARLVSGGSVSDALTVRDRLEVLRPAGHGPAATVFVAERVRDGVRELVCVKVPAPDIRAEALQRAWIVQQQLGRLQQRHLTGAAERAMVGERPGILRAWVEGIDVQDWADVLRETGVTMPGRVICELLRSTSVALDAALPRTAWGDAHPLGVLHRDLKPTNILVGRDGDVRVVDFGAGATSLAGASGERAAALRAGHAKYVAPERLADGPAAHASDVYALGIIGIELFARRWLRRTRTSHPAHDRHLSEVVAAMPDPDMRSQTDDRALRALLLRMVAWDAAARPSAVEVAHTLRALGDRAPGPCLETFAHDHALPYLESPGPRADDAPPARLGWTTDPEATVELPPVAPSTPTVDDEVTASWPTPLEPQAAAVAAHVAPIARPAATPVVATTWRLAPDAPAWRWTGAAAMMFMLGIGIGAAVAGSIWLSRSWFG